MSDNGIFKTRSKASHPRCAAHRLACQSRRTEEYLRSFLETNGYAGRIVLFNGTNTDADSKAVYKRWVAANAGTGRVSGSRPPRTFAPPSLNISAARSAALSGTAGEELAVSSKARAVSAGTRHWRQRLQEPRVRRTVMEPKRVSKVRG